MKLLTNSLTQRTGWLLPVPMSSKAGWIVGSMRFSGWIGQQVLMLKRTFVFKSYMQIIVPGYSVKCIHTPKCGDLVLDSPADG